MGPDSFELFGTRQRPGWTSASLRTAVRRFRPRSIFYQAHAQGGRLVAPRLPRAPRVHGPMAAPAHVHQRGRDIRHLAFQLALVRIRPDTARADRPDRVVLLVNATKLRTTMPESPESSVNYRYEGRWPERTPHLPKYARNLSTWIAEVRHENEPHPMRTLKRLWVEVQNYCASIPPALPLCESDSSLRVCLCACCDPPQMSSSSAPASRADR